jgi:hypothetical protein
MDHLTEGRTKRRELTRRHVTRTALSVGEDRMASLWEEAIILHLWLTAKVLAPDKEVLDVVHNRFMEEYRAQGASAEFEQYLLAKIHDRYGRYYGAWNSWDSGGLFSLADEILRWHLTGGKGDHRLLAHCPKVVPVIQKFVSVVIETRDDFDVEGA